MMVYKIIIREKERGVGVPYVLLKVEFPYNHTIDHEVHPQDVDI